MLEGVKREKIVQFWRRLNGKTARSHFSYPDSWFFTPGSRLTNNQTIIHAFGKNS